MVASKPNLEEIAVKTAAEHIRGLNARIRAQRIVCAALGLAVLALAGKDHICRKAKSLPFCDALLRRS